MRSSSSPGFDFRDAVDGLRETVGSFTKPRAKTDGTTDRDVRSAILVELSEAPMHGYQLIEAIDVRSGRAWKPSAGAVYPTLQLLTDEQLVTAEQVGERRVFSLTQAGRLAAADIGEPVRPGAAQPRAAGVQGAFALTKSGATLAQVLLLVAQTGTPGQSERAIAIVDDARRKLSSLLAED